jgi:hypothetical protein
MSQQVVTTQEQALSLLIQAVRVAQSKGVYALEDAGLLAQAIGIFTPDPEPTPVEVTEEEPESED